MLLLGLFIITSSYSQTAASKSTNEKNSLKIASVNTENSTQIKVASQDNSVNLNSINNNYNQPLNFPLQKKKEVPYKNKVHSKVN